MSLNNQKIFREFLAVVPPSVQYMVICSQFKEIIEANSFFLKDQKLQEFLLKAIQINFLNPEVNFIN